MCQEMFVENPNGCFQGSCFLIFHSRNFLHVTSHGRWNPEKGGLGPSLYFAISYFPINFLVEQCFSLGTIKFHHSCPLPEKCFWPPLFPPLEKNPSDAHATARFSPAADSAFSRVDSVHYHIQRRIQLVRLVVGCGHFSNIWLPSLYTISLL